MFKGVILPALKTTWRNKTLWLISVLTITPLTLVNEWKMLINTLNGFLYPFDHFIILINTINGVAPEGVSMTVFFKTIISQPSAGLSFFLSVIIGMVFLIFFVWIVSNAQAIILLNTSRKYRESKTPLSGSLNKTAHYWKSIAALNITLFIIRLFIMTLLIIAGLSMFGTGYEILYWVLATVAIIVLLFLSYSFRIGILEIIFKSQSVYSALTRGITSARKNFGKCLELSFILFVITFVVVTVFVSLISLLLSDDQLSLSIINVLLLKQGYLTLLAGFLFLVAVLFISGLVLLFEYTAWVYWYELENNKPTTVVRRILNRFKKE